MIKYRIFLHKITRHIIFNTFIKARCISSNKNQTLSLTSSHSGLVGFLRVRYNETAKSSKAVEIVMIVLSSEYVLNTDDIPPIQIIIMKNGRINFTINNHVLPIFICLDLEFKKSSKFSALYIQAKSIHSRTIQNNPEI